MKIKCTTLFDITKTGVNPRRRDINMIDDELFELQCGQQSNFETLLQIINLRSQPEDITDPILGKTKLDKKSIWGKEYSSSRSIPTWSFEFSIAHTSAFKDNENELGLLFLDSEGVPMIKGLTEWKDLSNNLSNESQYKNIHWEVIE